LHLKLIFAENLVCLAYGFGVAFFYFAYIMEKISVCPPKISRPLIKNIGFNLIFGIYP